MSENQKSDPKSLLLDLAKEADGESLEDFCTVMKGGKAFKFEIRLPNEEEANWTFRYMNPSNVVTVATSMKLPNLSISIRSINGISVDDFFMQEWEELPEFDRLEYESKNKFAQKYFAAEHMMQYLGQRTPDFVQELWEHYEALDKRRKEAQAELGNSSGEDSEKGESENSTEASPLGEPSVTAPK
jgi:hypothetical protein